MIDQDLVYVSDCSLLEADELYELSFKEKIELCRLTDKLGVSSIDLYPIRQAKIDRLLIKSICSAVKNAVIAVPVTLTEDDSVLNTWSALKEAGKRRLQVVIPVSSVQMEYMLHMKPDAVISLMERKVKECLDFTEDVEFIAQDASRSDSAFLLRILDAAIQSGVKTITLCDTAGIMMPDEIHCWIKDLKEKLPALNNVVIGFYCSGELNMADACAVSAIRAGVREIKTTSCTDKSISLSNMIRILHVKGRSFGVCTHVGTEQIRRITDQVQMICHTSGRKIAADEKENNLHENDMLLSVHDSIETVMHAVEKLGYDLYGNVSA